MISVRWSLSCTNGSSKQKLSHSGMHLAQQDIDVLLLLIEGNSCEITRDRKSYLDMLISVVSEWLHLTQWPLRPPMSGVTAMSLLCNTRVRRITHHAPSRHSLGFILASHTHMRPPAHAHFIMRYMLVVASCYMHLDIMMNWLNFYSVGSTS